MMKRVLEINERKSYYFEPEKVKQVKLKEEREIVWKNR